MKKKRKKQELAARSHLLLLVLFVGKKVKIYLRKGTKFPILNNSQRL